MAVATGRRPPFDNIVVSNFRKRIARNTVEHVDCRRQLREKRRHREITHAKRVKQLVLHWRIDAPLPDTFLLQGLV